ncbi:hypothetical protein SAMN02910292_01808 [Lachnospiraceae bacterium XBB2008]|nr:hypothetical protein SAMN02910292_01808 [Lachnospiraceae bacterium XBB2008]
MRIGKLRAFLLATLCFLGVLIFYKSDACAQVQEYSYVIGQTININTEVEHLSNSVSWLNPTDNQYAPLRTMFGSGVTTGHTPNSSPGKDTVTLTGIASSVGSAFWGDQHGNKLIIITISEANSGAGSGGSSSKTNSSSVNQTAAAIVVLPATDPSGRPNYGADGHIHNWGPDVKNGNVSTSTCSLCNMTWSYGHDHVYEWVEAKQATEDENGECEYRCRICGNVLYRVPTNAMGVFAQNTINKIVKARQGETVVIDTSRWYSFPKSVFDALAARPDLTLTVNYLSEGYKGDPMSFTIPAGTDVSTLPDANGFAGFTYLGGLFEATSR